MLIDRTHRHQLYLVGIFNQTRNPKMIKWRLIQPQASGADTRDTFVETMSNTSIERNHHRHRNDNSENGRSLVATSRALQDIVVMTRHAMIRSICRKLNRRNGIVDCETNLIDSILVPLKPARRSQMDSNRRNHPGLQYQLESYYRGPWTTTRLPYQVALHSFKSRRVMGRNDRKQHNLANEILVN